MENKREGDREAAGEVFLSSDPLYHCFFGIGEGKGELLKLLLQMKKYLFLEKNCPCIRPCVRERDIDRKM
jgi:hypothetical protein